MIFEELAGMRKAMARSERIEIERNKHVTLIGRPAAANDRSLAHRIANQTLTFLGQDVLGLRTGADGRRFRRALGGVAASTRYD